MKSLRLVLGDQLCRSISSLNGIESGRDIVLMVEVMEEATYVPHHKQKLVLTLSAMRHFADALSAEGIHVDYVRIDDEGNSGSFTGELARALLRHRIGRIIATEPGEWRVWAMMQQWGTCFDVPVEIREDDRFLCTRTEFLTWAGGRRSFRMESFYRHMRRKTGWLMQGGEPEGGRWNYDAENRKALPADLLLPARRRFLPDAITKTVMNLVRQHFSGHFGELDSFNWAVTREGALEALKHFVVDCLGRFGDYQDAMKTGKPELFHSLLSPYLNAGLLCPNEVCESVLNAYRQGVAPLPATEGFIRQILGWREFVRGVYWLQMPDYAKTNFFNADRQLPEFYWSAATDLKCLHEVVAAIRTNAYAHHIQRLMITGNFALLAGIDPAQVEEWYLSVFVDAFDWVELPNTHGMALYADGGVLASKPYAASGAYIHKMSDYCSGCIYKPTVKLGPDACPFNYLYWYFLIRNQARLESNPRMVFPYRTLARMPVDRRRELVRQAETFLARLRTI